MKHWQKGAKVRIDKVGPCVWHKQVGTVIGHGGGYDTRIVKFVVSKSRTTEVQFKTYDLKPVQ
jgi:hypothetical protein